MDTFEKPLLSDRTLRKQVIALASNARELLPVDPSITDIEQCFCLKVGEVPLPLDKEGAFIEGESKIIINSNITSRERRNFTLYHELIHYLIREDEDLYSYLHDAYEASDEFDRTIEYLCNIGAAELIISRDMVRELIAGQGFSINLVPQLCDADCVSGPAALIQIIQCAPHHCYGVVCEHGFSPTQFRPNQHSYLSQNPVENLYILYSTWSPSAKYSIARFTNLAKNHLLSTVLKNKEFIEGRDKIPFRSGKGWPVPCQAMFFRNCVYGIFNVDPPPDHRQPRLF